MTPHASIPRDPMREALAEARADIAAESVPVPGFYRMKLHDKGPWVPVRIHLWLGQPLDPAKPPRRYETVYRAQRRGFEIDVSRVWPWCADEPIDETEYAFLLARAQYAMQHDNSLPDATPTQAVDYGSLRFNF